MKCRSCRGPAVIDVPASNANFCSEHFQVFCRSQVSKAIKRFSMFGPDDRILVAVSGGKDSLALWHMLVELGYSVDGFAIGLGIGEYSETSTQYSRTFAEAHGLTLHEVDLRDEYGYDVPFASQATKRVACSACGISKRHLFDKAALDGDYDVVATGHNLDDEAAVLFGNSLRWATEYLARQRPVLDAHDGFPRKVKPLIRLGERETAAYCVVSGIDYMVDECPKAAGNRHLGYKHALNVVEAQSPGAKFAYYHEFLAKAADLFDDGSSETPLRPCSQCGSPCGGEICAFCHLLDRVEHHKAQVDNVPVHLREKGRS